MVHHDLDTLVAAVEELAAEVHSLALLVGRVAANTGIGKSLRTGAMCRLVGVHRATLYAWSRAGLVLRGEDAIGEVVWDRDEVLRVHSALRRNTRRRRARTPRDGRSIVP